MRTPWLAALFLILLPLALISLKLFSDFVSFDLSSLLDLWIPLIVVVLCMIAISLLLRTVNWHPRNRRRH
jgi:amino acid transporter